MVKKVSVFILFLLNVGIGLAQQSGFSRPIIDSTAIDHWERLGENYQLSISNDGNYFSYILVNKPFGKETLVVQSTTDSWKQEFSDASPIAFSADSKHFIFKINDTLCILQVGTNVTRFVKGIVSFKKPQTNFEWLAWQLKDDPKDVVLFNLVTGDEKHFGSVTDYRFNTTGNILFIKTHETANKNGLELVSFPEGTVTKVWSSENNNSSVGAFVVDGSGTQIAFMVQENKEDQLSNSIWYYRLGLNKATMKVSNQSSDIASNLYIAGIAGFTKNGKFITFSLQQTSDYRKPNTKAVKLDIWNYKDDILYSAQPKEFQSKTYLAAIETGSEKVITLTSDDENLRLLSNSDFAVIGKEIGGDRFWDKNYKKDSNWVVSLKDGSRTLLKAPTGSDFWFSPLGNYLVYYDRKQRCNYFSYNLNTGKLTNISAAVPAYRLGYEEEYQLQRTLPSFEVGLAGWLSGDSGVLVYDNYDIWSLDLAGQRPPVNITNGYGRLHHIKFRLQQNEPVFDPLNSFLLMKAFNVKNKFNGFYKKKLSHGGDPELLTMGPFVFDLRGPHMVALNSSNFNEGSGMEPLKAKDKKVWIVKRQSATDPPNYFLTTDFKNYKQLTNLQPQKQYNWLTAELVNFTQLDGTRSQGVLYKPEDFDSSKKYPVLFNYYEQMSHRLYQFPTPNFMHSGNIDVAWFVSRGYLVFTPDIYFYGSGFNGQSALNTIVGAANYLSKLPFVDEKKMAISGHSMGGALTNHIATHTNLFAAVLSGAGASDWISIAFQTSGPNGTRGWLNEDMEKRLGGNLWKSPQKWFETSPIKNVYRVTSPMLIFQCKADQSTPWEQGVELFVALRRLNKKAWMLQYDNGDHIVGDKNDQVDLTIRSTQFFDHYLKDSACPRWMLYGIPAKDKGIDDGLQLVYEKDKNGKWLTPQSGGLLTDEEKKKVEALKKRKPVRVTIE